VSEARRPERDAWDKAEIILRPVGGLLTALAVAIVGFWTSSYLRDRESKEGALRERMQTSDTNARLYSELISKREESESALRKDMFKSIIDSFLRTGSSSIEDQVLNLELLVYNFHESLNLKPLFLHVQREVMEKGDRGNFIARLDRVAGEITKKQMLVLEEGGVRFDTTLDTKTLEFSGGGAPGAAGYAAKDLSIEGVSRNFRLEALRADPATQELELRLTIRTPPVEGGAVETTATEFWVGYFDFPMIDNTRLSRDQRCAIVLNNFDNRDGTADLTLVYFPGKYAGLREKPYYDEVVARLLAANRGDAPRPAPVPKK
jgi:hypothetical protein